VKNSLAKLVTVFFIALLLASIVLFAMPTLGQWYIDDEQHGMGWWGKNAKIYRKVEAYVSQAALHLIWS
jgi:hypothetical protein